MTEWIPWAGTAVQTTGRQGEGVMREKSERRSEMLAEGVFGRNWLGKPVRSFADKPLGGNQRGLFPRGGNVDAA